MTRVCADVKESSRGDLSCEELQEMSFKQMCAYSVGETLLEDNKLRKDTASAKTE